ncbi:MAG: SufD family Fe-S cluster assembly protein [Thermoguttaceae bacterium]|jgi:Fe-S cluster assembly scaffold protein SufB|nr:SufD family Fe-S cluster assembly protein [Thermoguttaceae bacterium]
MGDDDLLKQLYQSIGIAPHALRGRPDIARIEVHANRVLGAHLVPGLEVDAHQRKDGVEARIRVIEGAVIEHPIQVCFGMIPESGVQQIVLEIDVGPRARAGICAHCTFPNARKVRHEMDAVIQVGEGAQYAYFERHVHGPEGGVVVLPRSRVHVARGARFQTEFELLRGRVGEIDIDLEAHGEAHSTTEINARISGTGNDRIQIREGVHLAGEYARGVLTSHIALRDTARAEIFNTLTASAAFARGHVDCKEIIQDQALARAVPIVEVNHPKAHVTHEAAIGSVDSRQLETLMARGLNEDEAVDLIIQGLLGGASAFAAPLEGFLPLEA